MSHKYMTPRATSTPQLARARLKNREHSASGKEDGGQNQQWTPVANERVQKAAIVVPNRIERWRVHGRERRLLTLHIVVEWIAAHA